MGLFLVAVALVWPVVESGFMDDWSYVRTAEVLGTTGHLVYNGWATALLGWPLLVAAAFVKVFGDSFSVVRGAQVLIGAACAAVLHRLLLRAGLNAWNTTIVTCAFLLSPVFLTGSIAFMSDVPGLLAVLVCLYGCLHAVQSRHHAVGWIVFAALSNVVLGTARQIAWLGVLVMVPSAMWVLRRQRPVLVAGGACVVAGAAAIVASLRWFNAQTYSVAEHLDLASFRHITAQNVVTFVLRLVFDAVLLSLPICLAFAPALRRIARVQAVALVLAVAAFVPLLYHEARRRAFHEWLSPFLLFRPAKPYSLETMFTNVQVPIKGAPELPLTDGVRWGLTGVCVLALSCVLAATIYARQSPPEVENGRCSRRQLAWLVVPYALSYVLLLMPRGLTAFAYDRYCLLLLPPVLLYLVRWYQDRLADRLPVYSVVVAAVVGLYSVLSLHDVFVAYRSSLRLIGEVRAAGVPRSTIDGGWEYNSYTQILEDGYVRQPGARLPDGRRVQVSPGTFAGPCSRDIPEWTPGVHPLYTVANPASGCAAVPGFASVAYTAWLPPFHREAYVARYATQASEVGSKSDPH